MIVGAAVAQSPPPPDHCEQYTDCEICVSHYLCGWCSTPVIYQGNITGKQCAGYNPNGNDPFECNGIYSIEQCTVGYVCDLENFQCKQAGPGKGSTLSSCEANCTNMGQVYLCNETSLTCHQVASGTPGASSYQVCESACKHPKSAHPAPPQSPAPAAQVYKCDTATGQCVNASAGQGSSMAVCMQQCQKSDNKTKYFCNTITHECEKAPAGFPGEDKDVCEAECKQHPNPGPPPLFLGLWRGIQIQNGYKIGEFDIEITQSTFVWIDIRDATTIKGTPYNVKNGEKLELWVKITSGPGAGQTLKAIGEDWQRGPETTYLTAAFSGAGGATPKSIDDAMRASSGDAVYFLMSCVGTPECIFTMPSSARGKRLPLFAQIHRNKLTGIEQRVIDLQTAGVEDPCAAFAANCSYCIAHEHCGWCSSDVIYKGGSKGTQCAGFASDPNATNPFVCEGRYSTLDCTQGWTCNEQSLQCEQNAAPGNGFPKAECLEVCRPTPSPTPKLQQYVCNITSHQCHKCEDDDCPGSMPEATCEASCKKPHKGPTHLVVGVWRGLQIQNNYPLAEWEWVFNSSSLTVYRNGVMKFAADVTSYGGDEMIFTVSTGANAGSKFSSLYTIADQGRLYEVMTLAMSASDGPVPTGYAGPMQTAGQVEVVLAKCSMTLCKFNTP
jgi:hypothetical protein